MLDNVTIADASDLYEIANIMTDQPDMPYAGMEYLTKHNRRYPDTIAKYVDKDNKIRGFATYYINENKHSTFIVLECIYVAPAYRNQRIGHSILCMIEEMMHDMKINTIFLNEAASYNTVEDFFEYHEFSVYRHKTPRKDNVLRLAVA